MKTLLLISVLGLQYSLAETWTRAKDNKKIEADFVSYEKLTDTLSLKLKSGKTVKIKGAILSLTDQEKIKTLASDAAPEKKAEPKAPKVVGKSTLKTVSVPGVEHQIHINYPPGYDTAGERNKDRPMLVIFDSEHNTKRTVSKLNQICEEMGWLVVGIDSYSNARLITNKDEKGIERDTKKVAKYLEKELVYNPDKIILGGFSGGGYWSYLSSASTFKKTTGILAIGTWMNYKFKLKYPKNMAIAMINADQDKSAKKEEKEDREFLEKKRRAEVKLFPYPGGHFYPPASLVVEAAKWLAKTKNL